VRTLLIAEVERAAAVSIAVESFRDFGCELVSTPSWPAASSLLQEDEFQALLVSSADANELTQAVRDARQLAPEIAILAIMESDDPLLAQRLIRAGADDVTSGLGRSFEQAFATALQRAALGPAELDYLVRLARGSTTSVTSSLFGNSPLRDSHPADFETLVAGYANLFDKMLEARSFRMEIDLKEQLRALAHRLGELNAGPRDVIELHTAALGAKMRTDNPARVRGYIDEGKMLVLELMGYIVSFYRSHSIGLRRRSTERAVDGPR